jgi:uncharacterized protein YndB with AHSA1/START domain
MTAATEGFVEVERRIAARPETVFSYFTDPARYRLWQGVDAELDPRPGGLFRVTMTSQSQAVVRGEYVEVEPPNRLVITWGWEPWDGQPDIFVAVGSSRVEITLEPDGDDTILRVQHSGLADPQAYQFHNWGWGLTLDRLAAVAVGGDPGPNPLATA